jgi:4-diphosphocytidyl-2-C-methyl-D-erythritol kinase
MSSDIRVRAFAKINLSLRVLGTRADGYHELRTVFQSIALHDTLVVRRTRGPFSISLDRPRSVPIDRDNLVWRAAEALWTSMRRRGAVRGVSIHLVKRIPVQAGLGGGSSDAAATLRVLARLWRADAACVRGVAVRLGADVPFFLEGGTVLGLDRGDVLFPLIDRPRAWVVIVIPPFGISTPDAYRWWDERASDQRPTNVRRLSDVVPTSVGPNDGGNDLQAPVAHHHPDINRIVRDLIRAGADSSAMSGSGSAVFGLFPTQTAARRAAHAVVRPDRRVLVTRTLTRAAHQRLAGK